MNENTPLSLKSAAGAYDQTKAMGAQAVLDTVKEGLDAVIVCPSGVIGPYDYRGSEMGGLIKSFAESNIHFIVNGAYDFVDVRDVADGMILAAEKGRSGEIYILSGQQVTLRQLSKLTRRVTARRSLVIAIPLRLALFVSRYTQYFYRWFKKTPKFTLYSLKTVVENSSFSRAKAEKELGYRARPLDESIRDFLAWRAGHFQKYYHQKSDKAKTRALKPSKAKNPG